MAVSYKNTTIATANKNGSLLTRILYKGVDVFSGGGGQSLVDDFDFTSGSSNVPGPYDSGGYNYGASAPKVSQQKTITFDLPTGTKTVVFDYNVSGSYCPFGEVYFQYFKKNGSASMIYERSGTGVVFSTDDKKFTIAIEDIPKNTDGKYTITFEAGAKSWSNYKNYGAGINIAIKNVTSTK